MELDEFFLATDKLSQFAKLYLAKMGWFKSLNGIPHDNDGVVPLITYPALRQLKRIIEPGFRVFEFGCGASSVWWAKNVAEVVSVEHNAEWAARVMADRPKNLTVIVREMNAPIDGVRAAILEKFFEYAPDLPLSPDTGHNIMHGLLTREFLAYVAELACYPAGHFNVIVVDGMARCMAAWLAGQFLKPGGFIVFDDTERWQYNAAYRILRTQGYHRIDYYGPGPVHPIERCTSIFTRSLDAFAFNVDSPPGDSDLGW